MTRSRSRRRTASSRRAGGLTPKFGRFFSGLGYLNEQHAARLGLHRRAARLPGVSRRPVPAPTACSSSGSRPPTSSSMLGAEMGNGDSSRAPIATRTARARACSSRTRAATSAYSSSWRAGLSYLRTAARDRTVDVLHRACRSPVPGSTDRRIPLAFTGTSHVAVADFVWKWAPNGNAHDHELQAAGRVPVAPGERATSTLASAPATSGYSSRQSGWYLQGVYQFMPQWRVGVRYDRLDPAASTTATNAAYSRRDRRSIRSAPP